MLIYLTRNKEHAFVKVASKDLAVDISSVEIHSQILSNCNKCMPPYFGALYA